MTTNVVVTAHCATTKEVAVIVKDGSDIIESVKLQDGQTAEFYAYDDRVISVRELDK